MRPVITLSSGDCQRADVWQDMLRQRAVQRGYRDHSGTGDLHHGHWARAELAFCNFQKAPWKPNVNGFHKEPDLWLQGVAWEVRSSKFRRAGLWVHPENDRLERAFALVVQLSDANFRMEGWAYGEEVRVRGSKWKGGNILLRQTLLRGWS